MKRRRGVTQPQQIGLVISTYNRPDALAVVLASVARQSVIPHQVVIADDGSSAATARLVEDWRGRLRTELIHVWQEDTGYRLARSRNRAIAAITTDYVVSIDGDMVLHPRFMEDHAQCARPDCFIQGGRVWLPQQASERMIRECDPAVSPLQRGLGRRAYAFHSPLLSRLTSRARLSVAGIQGCNQSYWRKHLEIVNGFDERFATWGYEDSDLAARLMHAGVKRYYLRHRAIAFHLYHPSNAHLADNPNRSLLLQTLQQQRIRCEHGLSGHTRIPFDPLRANG
jgi:glycosyltransferase involved in cell wall biosynthesis